MAYRKKSLFFLSYFIHLDQKSGESGAFYSKHWEKLPEHLQNMGFQLNWVHLFLTSPGVPDAQTATVWLNRFQKDSEKQGSHALLDQYLDLQLIGQVMQFWVRVVFFYTYTLRKQSEDLCQKEHGWLWPIFTKDWEDSWIGPVAMQNILWLHLFDKMLRSLPQQQVGLYLMENQGWERIFLYFWRKHAHGNNHWSTSFHHSLLGFALFRHPHRKDTF